MLHAATTFLNRGPTGLATRFAGSAPGGGKGRAHGARGPLSCEPPGSSLPCGTVD